MRNAHQSLRRNILANYVSQIYVTLAGIVMLPLYIKYMGAEAYGLVGFFFMLQAFFVLLDVGLTPTVSREVARFHGGSMSRLSFRQLYRALGVIFLLISVIGGGALFLSAKTIATTWLNPEALSMADVSLAVQIMVVAVAMRWLGGLFRGVITGSEQLVWISGFNAAIATLRFVIVLPVMWAFGFTPIVFFVYQLFVALLEVTVLAIKSWQLIPSLTEEDPPIGWSFTPIKSVLRFALTIAFTSSVWVLVTQVDKLALSGVLSLEEYGYFTLAVLVASGIMLVSGPISLSIMPRMARLHAEDNKSELLKTYRSATQIVAVTAGSVAITVTVCAQQLLLGWTGDAELAQRAAPILQLYAIGNGLLAVSAFPFYLQYAKGNLRLHLIGNAVMLAVLVPGIVLAATWYGGIGAGYVWLATNLLYFSFWVAFVHSRLEANLHSVWIKTDVLRIVLPGVLLGVFISQIDFESANRLENLGFVAVSGLLVISLSTLCSSFFMRLVLDRWEKSRVLM